jgi:ankyrin repeat protein
LSLQTKNSHLNFEDYISETLHDRIKKSSSDLLKTERIQRLLKTIRENKQQPIATRTTVWAEEFKIKALKENNFRLFCFLTFLGGKMNNAAANALINKLEHERNQADANDANDAYDVNDANKFPMKLLLNHSQEENGNNLLFLAAAQGKIRCLKVLIENQVDLNIRSPTDGMTPLFYAVLNGQTRFAEILIENGASVNICDFFRQTPLHIAANMKQKELAEMLISKGADIEATDKAGCTPLFVATWYEQLECLELLLDKLADTEAKDIYSFTPLHVAARYGKVDCLKLLINRGADVNAATLKGNTALHMLAKFSESSAAVNEQCAELLIRANADRKAVDEEGQTIIDFPFYRELRVRRRDLFPEFTGCTQREQVLRSTGHSSTIGIEDEIFDDLQEYQTSTSPHRRDWF